MEEDLDQIEEGTLTRVNALNEFYRPFSEQVGALTESIEGGKRVFRVLTDVACEKCGAHRWSFVTGRDPTSLGAQIIRSAGAR
jgi:hypothetical protein